MLREAGGAHAQRLPPFPRRWTGGWATVCPGPTLLWRTLLLHIQGEPCRAGHRMSHCGGGTAAAQGEAEGFFGNPLFPNYWGLRASLEIFQT